MPAAVSSMILSKTRLRYQIAGQTTNGVSQGQYQDDESLYCTSHVSLQAMILRAQLMVMRKYAFLIKLRLIATLSIDLMA